MKICSPLRSWVNLLASVPKRDLLSLANKTANLDLAVSKDVIATFIRDQPRQLGNMHIMGPSENAASTGNGTTPMVKVWPKPRRKVFWEPQVPLPDEPMPENIHNFKIIDLSYLDKSVLNFLQQFGHNSLLNNVNLAIPFQKNMASQHLALAHLLPLIGSINSLCALNINPLRQIYNAENGNEEYTKMMSTMVAQAKVLEMRYDILVSDKSYEQAYPGDENNGIYVTNRTNINECCHWLYTPRMDGNPRVLILHRYKPKMSLLPEQMEQMGISPFEEDDEWKLSANLPTVSPFIDRIKEDFLKATQPSSFVIRIVVDWLDHRKDIYMQNDQTKEKLVIKRARSNGIKIDNEDRLLLISRHPLDATDEWVRQNEAKALHWDFDSQMRQIRLARSLEIAL